MRNTGSDQELHRYDDIIDLPHHQSRRAHMSIYDRAAQFSPFAALTGHEEAIQETARLTDEFVELDESEKEELNRKLGILQERLKNQICNITLTYFCPDAWKSGGRYLTVSASVKKIEAVSQSLVLVDDSRILIRNIFEMLGDVFDQLS